MLKPKIKPLLLVWLSRLRTAILRFAPKTGNGQHAKSQHFAKSVVRSLFLLIALTGVFLYTRAGTPARVEAATPATLNFQARLLSANGAIAPDGVYNVEFKLYDDATAGNLVWTETRLVTDAANLQVQVRSGYLSVYLGDKTAFGAINWDQQLYLTMNIGGTNNSPSWDGEMTPRLRLTSVPYAVQAQRAEILSKTVSSNLAQLLFPNSLGQATNYNLIDPGTGSVDICLSTGNCAGAGGGITGAGNQNRIAYFNTSNTIGSSVLLQGTGTLTVDSGTDLIVDGGALTVNGNIAVQDYIDIAASSDPGVSSSGFGRMYFDEDDNTFKISQNGDPFYDICTTGGNCAGSGSGVTAAGTTAGYIPLLTGTQQLGNSALFQDSPDNEVEVANGYDFLILGGNLDVDGDGSFTGNLAVDGDLTVGGNTILGDADTDLLTITGTAVAIPNGLNFDANTLIIDAANNRIGIGISGTAADLLSVGGTTGNFRVDTNGAITAAAGLTTSGTVRFSSLTTNGLLKTTSGNGTIAVATAGTDYEEPLTFGNGLTRTSNAISLGGNLATNTTLTLNGQTLTVTGSGGSTIFHADGTVTIGASGVGLAVTNDANVGGTLTADILDVTNDATIGGELTTDSLTVTTDATVGGELTADSLTVTTDAGIGGNLTVTGTLSVTSTSNFVGAVTLGNDDAVSPIQGQLIFHDDDAANGFALTLQTEASLSDDITVTFPNPTSGITGIVCYQGDTACGFLSSGSASGFVSLAPNSAQTDNTNNSSIFINKGALNTGNLIRLQSNSTDKFVVDYQGNATVAGTFGVTGAATFTGLSTFNGGVTIEAGDTFTMNGDAFTDLTGSGLVLNTGALTVDASSATGFFRNGGNSFGVTAVLGTNDANDLNLRTDGNTRVNITAGGNVGIGTSGAPSQLLSVGGTTGNFTVDSTGAVTAVGVNGGAGLIQGTGGLTITGTTNINASGSAATNIGTGTGNTTVGNGTGTLTLQGSSLIINAPTLSRTAAGTTTIDLVDSANTTLALTNSSTGVANFTVDGSITAATGLTVTSGGITVSAGGIAITGNSTINGTLSGLTGLSSSGDIDFASLNAGGLVKAATTTGRLSIAVSGTDYEAGLTFNNGLTRTTNTVTLGGNLNTDTTLGLNGHSVTFDGSAGEVVINSAGLLTAGNGLSVTGTTDINTSGNAATNIGTGTGNVAIGNSTGTLSITSNGGLNVTTGGAVSGVSTLSTSGIITVGTLGTANTDTVVCRNSTNQLAACTSTFATTTQLQGYVQFAPASAQADNSTNSSIYINKTNTGNLIRLQTSATDMFVVDNSGNVDVAGTFTAGTGNAFTINASGAITAATGITSSGTITFSGLTPDRLVATTTGGQLTNSISSANLAASVTDETGTGNLVFSASPTFTGTVNVAGLTASGTVAANVLNVTTDGTFGGDITVSGGNATLGAAGQAGSIVLFDGASGGSANTITLNVDATLGQNSVITFPDPGGATAEVCYRNDPNCGFALTAGSGFVQFTPNAAQSDASAFPSIWINDTGGGDLIRLQSGGSDVFVISSAGVVTAGTWNGTAIGAQYGGTGINTSASTGVPTISSGTWSVSAQLPVSLGGTGAATLTSNGVLLGNGTSAVTAITGTSAQVLIVNGSGVPTFATFSGDVTVSNTGVTTIQPNSVALGTDTVGNFVDDVAAGLGLTVSGTPGEGFTETVSFDYTASLAGNPALGAGHSLFGDLGIIFEGSTANNFETLLTVTDPTADRTITLPNVNGTVITTGNLADITAVGTVASGTWQGTAIGATYGGTGIDTSGSTGVPTISSGTWSVQAQLPVSLGGTGAATLTQNGVLLGNGTSAISAVTGTSAQVLIANGSGVPTFTTFTGDVTVSNTGVTTIGANTVTLGTDTVGNFVDNVAAGLGLAVSGTPGEGFTETVSFDYTASLAGNPALGAGQSLFGDVGVIFEGATANAFETLLTVADPTADNTITLPNVSGTVITTGNLTQITAVGTVASGTWQGTAIGSQYGGTGQNFSSSTGVPTISSGTWSVQAQLPVSLGGTGAATLTQNGILMGNGTNDVTAITGTSAQILVVNGSGVPTFTTLTGDVTVSNTGVTTIGANTVTLGTDTVGNFVNNVSGGLGIDVSGTPGEGFTETVSFDYGASLAGNPALNGGESLFGDVGIIFEGATANAFETLLTVADPTADNTITLPNVSGTVITTGNLTQITAVGTIASGTWQGTAIGSQYGGTGQNFSSSTGIPTISSGTWSVQAQLPVSLGGTGAATLAQNGVVLGNGTSALSAVTGTSAQILVVNGSGVPAFVDMTGDVTVSNTGVTTIGANSVALGTDTTGNYVADINAGTGIAVTGTLGEGWTPTISLDYASTLASNNLSANQSSFASTGLLFEGATANGFETLLMASDPTADNTITLPDASGAIVLNTSGSSIDGVSAFVQGGTNFGSTTAGVLGTANNGDLNIVTNGNTRLVVEADGDINLAGNTLFVDRAARSGSGGNLVKIGNSTGTDGALTILQVDSATADPTSNLNALNGGLFYNSTDKLIKAILDGQVDEICFKDSGNCSGGSGGVGGSGQNNEIAIFNGTNTLDSSANFTFDSTGAGTFTVNAITNLNTSGSNGINIGTGTYSGTIAIGNSASTTNILGAVNINDSGAATTNIAYTSGTGAVNIGNATGNLTLQGNTTSISSQGTLNIGTNAVAQTITVGNSTGATSVTLNAGTGGVNIATNGVANTIQIGNTSGAVAQNINIGTNNTGGSTSNVTIGSTVAGNITLQSAATISIGNNAAAQTLNIGNTTGATALNLYAGTGNFTLDGVGATTYTLGASTTTGTITLGGTSQTGALTLGSSNQTNSVLIGNGTGATTVNIANANTGGAVNIGNAFTTGTITLGGTTQTGTITLGQSTVTNTVNIANNVIGSGHTGSVNIATQSSGTGINVVTIGSVNDASSTTLQAGTGNINFNANQAQFTEVNGTRTLTVQTRTSNAAGSNLTISGGNAGTGGSAFSGGTLTLQGGAAAGTGNANGANVVVQGGAGVGTGVQGLVSLASSAFSASTTETSATSFTISQSKVDNNSMIPVNVTATGQTVTLPAPTQSVTGRILYLTNIGANAFTVSPSGGTNFILNPNSTATFVWNATGNAWTNAGVDGGSASYIQNQNAVQQTANFRISGTGQADGGLIAPSLERAAAGTLSVGTTNTTTAITVGSTNLTGTLAIDSGASSTINIGSSASDRTINIGNVAAVQGITVGSTNGASSLALQSGTGNLSITTQGTGILGIANNAVAQNVDIGNTTGATSIDMLVGTGNFTLNGVGASTYTLGAATTTGTFTIGGTSQTGAITLGSSDQTNSVLIGNGTGATTVNIANANTAGAVNIGGAFTTGTITLGSAVQTGTITVGRSTDTYTVNIANATTANGKVATVNIATNATGTGNTQVNIGSSNGASSVVINTGTGGASIGDNANTKTIGIGGNTADGADTILIATNSTSADTITIGNNNQDTAINLVAGNVGGIDVSGGLVDVNNPQALCLSGGKLSYCDNTNTTGTALLQGGNDFAGNDPAVIGTLNNGDINFITGGSTSLILSSGGGSFMFQQGTTIGTTTGNLNIQAEGTNVLSLDTTGTGAVRIADSAQDVYIGVNDITHFIEIATSGVTNDQMIAIGSSNNGSYTHIRGGTGSDAIIIQTGGGTIGIGDNAVAQNVKIGNSTGATSVVINSGTGNLTLATQGTGTLGVGNNAVAQNIAVGNTTGATQLNLRVGTGNFSLDGVAGSTYTFGASTTTGTILIGGTAQTGAITLGSSSGTNSVLIANGAGATTVSIANVASNATVNIATAATAGNITIGSTSNAGTLALQSGTGTINIGTTGSARSINIGTAAAVQTVALGSTNSTSTTAIRGGNGATAVTIRTGAGGTVGIADDAVANTVNIGTGAADKDVTVGSTNTTSSVTINTGTGTAGGDLNLGDTTVNSKRVDVGSVDNSGTSTINIATNTGAAQTIQIGGNFGVGGSNASSTIKLQAGTVGIDINAADSGGVTLQSFTNDSNAFRILTASGAGSPLLVADTAHTTPRILIGNPTIGGGTLSTAALVVTTQQITTTLRLGDSTNAILFNDTSLTGGVSGKLRFIGTAKNDVNLTLIPEFQGATLTPDGSNNIGTMTSDFCSGSSKRNLNATFCAASTEHNFYQWTTTQGSAQDYDVYVRWQVPSNFDTNNSSDFVLSMSGYRSSSNDEVRVFVYDYDDTTTACSDNGNTGVVVTGSNGWNENTSVGTSGCTIRANDVIVFRIRMTATNGNFARLGEINISYKAVF